MRRNIKGSTLIWAIAVIMLLTTVIGGGLTIAYSYYNRSLTLNSKRQAYITAKAITSNIANKIINYNPVYQSLIPEKVGESTLLNIEDLPDDVGEVLDAYILKSSIDAEGDTRLVISVAVSYADQEDVVNAELKQKKDEKGWMLTRYFKGKFDRNGNIYFANVVRNEMTVFVDVLMKEGIEGAASLILNDAQAMAKIKEVYPNYSLKVDNNLSNDNLRIYLYLVKFNGSWPKFYNESTTIADELGTTKNYIQPYFPKIERTGSTLLKSKKSCIVFANTGNEAHGSWYTSLIYNHDDGHWYKIPSVSVTILDSSSEEEFDKKWKSFKDNYIKKGILIE